MIQVLDSTLREGEQTPGVYFDPHIKLAIASLLDQTGVNIIESGHPAVSEEIYSTVEAIAKRKLKAIVGAHSRSIYKDVELALECGVAFLGIFYCVSEERLKGVFKKDLSEAITQITDVIKFAKNENPNLLVRYTPEDTVRSKFENVVAVATAAVESGADIISVADTTGFMVPGTKNNMFDYISNLRLELNKEGLNPKLAVHCHNDKGMALANAIDAYKAGVDIIDASVLGLGERAGIVDLAQLLVVLKTDFNEDGYNLKMLPELYDLVSRHSGVPVPVTAPIVGKNAFTHCAGVHTHAAALNPMHYESLNPDLIGRQRNFALDNMSGLGSINFALNLLNIRDVDDELISEILVEVKKVGQRGRIVELTELPHIVEILKHHKQIKKID